MTMETDRATSGRRALLTVVAREGGQATTRRLLGAAGQPFVDRSALRRALRTLTASGQLTAEPVSADDVGHARYLLTDLGRRSLGRPPAEPVRLRAAAVALRDAAEWVEGMAAGKPLMAAGGYEGVVDLLARALARVARAAVDGGHLARVELAPRVVAEVERLFEEYPDDRRVDAGSRPAAGRR
jgi:hypothetical protein